MLWLIRAKRCPTLHFTITTTWTKRHSLFATWLHAYLEIVNSFLPISRLRCVQLDLLHFTSVLFPACFIWEWRSRLYRVQFDCYISTACRVYACSRLSWQQVASQIRHLLWEGSDSTTSFVTKSTPPLTKTTPPLRRVGFEDWSKEKT